MIMRHHSFGDHPVVVLESHSAVRDCLASRIAQTAGLTLVGEASDCLQARNVLSEYPEAIIVADPLLKPFGAFLLIEELNRVRNRKRLLMVSRDEPPAIVLDQSLRLGASFVTGLDPVEELSQALVATKDGHRHFSPVVREKLVDPDAASPTVELYERLRTLTPRRFAVLMLKAWGYSVKEAAVALEVSVKSVDSHLNRLKNALCVRNRSDLAMLCLQEGLMNVSSVGFATDCPRCERRIDLGIAQWIQARHRRLEVVCCDCAQTWTCGLDSISTPAQQIQVT